MRPFSIEVSSASEPSELTVTPNWESELIEPTPEICPFIRAAIWVSNCVAVGSLAKTPPLV